VTGSQDLQDIKADLKYVSIFNTEIIELNICIANKLNPVNPVILLKIFIYTTED
jgi:hypothetical protein